MTSAKNITQPYTVLEYYSFLKIEIKCIVFDKHQIATLRLVVNNLLCYHKECSYKIALKNHAAVCHKLHFQ